MSVPADGTLTVPALLSRNAAGVPELVVSDRSPNVVEPVVFVRLTAPAVPAAVVIESNVLAPMFVDVALSALPALVVSEIVPAPRKLTVPALAFSSTPGAVLPAAESSTVRLETSNVPAVPLSSSPAWLPFVPVSVTWTSSIVPPPVALAPPEMPPPVPDGSSATPRTVLLAASVTTSLLALVIVGRLAALPV